MKVEEEIENEGSNLDSFNLILGNQKNLVGNMTNGSIISLTILGIYPPIPSGVRRVIIDLDILTLAYPDI